MHDTVIGLFINYYEFSMLSRAVRLVRQEIQTEADQKIAQIEADAASRIKAAERHTDAVQSQLQEAYREQVGLKKSRDQLQLTVQHLEETLKACQQQIAGLETTLQSLLVKKDQQITNLQQVYQQSIAELQAHHQSAIAAHQQEYAALLTHVEKQRAEERVKLEEWITKYRTLENQLQVLTVLEQNLRQDKEQFLQALQVLKLEKEHLQ